MWEAVDAGLDPDRRLIPSLGSLHFETLYSPGGSREWSVCPAFIQ